MKNFGITEFLAKASFNASQFLKTGAKEQAYMGFPINNIQLLFYKRRDLERKENETDENVTKKTEERLDKIYQTLQGYASNPPEEAQPNYPEPVVEMITEYQQKIAPGRASEAEVRGWNQKFNSFVDNNPAPLGGLISAVGQAVVSKAAGGLISKSIGLIARAVNPIVGFITKEVVSKALTWIAKNKDRFFEYLGGGLAIGGLVIGGTIGTVSTVAGVGLIGTGLVSGAGGPGAALGNLASAGGAALGAIATATIGAIAVPTAIAIIGIPIAVALILFIINSGAYVVPPGPPIALSNPFVDVTNSGTGNPNLRCGSGTSAATADIGAGEAIAQRAVQIANRLKPGFWNDLNYSPDYPELWNQARFELDPNPTYPGPIQGCGTCLFWCTWLVQKSYKENGVAISGTLGVGGMCSDFASRGKFISGRDATPTNIVAGSAVFFSIRGGFDHVGVVASVNQDAIKYVQSDALTAGGSITFNSSGVGVQNIGGIVVIGFGLP